MKKRKKEPHRELKALEQEASLSCRNRATWKKNRVGRMKHAKYERISCAIMAATVFKTVSLFTNEVRLCGWYEVEMPTRDSFPK